MKIKLGVFPLILLLLANLSFPARVLGEPVSQKLPEKTGDPAAEAEPLDLSNLAISESLGKIETRYIGKSPRWVVHIQDVHAHFAAQENIAAILDQLNAAYGIKTVAVEGSWHSTSLPKSWALPNAPKKQMLARALLEDHYLTGPGYAALFSQMPMTLIGIEDSKLYEENRAIYLEHLAKREEILKKVGALGQEINLLKGKLFNPDLLHFDQALLEFRKGKKAENFLPSLISKTEALEIDLSSFDQIVLLKNSLSVEKSLHKEKLKSEGARLVQAFKGKRLSFEELLRSGKVTEEKLRFYPELQKYMKLIRLQDQIAHRPLFSQLDEVIRRVKEKLMAEEAEKTLDQRSERFELAKKIILFQATPDDLKIYKSQAETLNAEIQKEGLGEALKLGLRFYEIAKKRDAVFFDKMTGNPKLNQNIAVVTGGFHSEGLSEQFENAGISYLVITPDLADEVPNEAVYFEKLKIGPAGTHALAFLLPFMFQINGVNGFDQQFYQVHQSSGSREILTHRNEFQNTFSLRGSAKTSAPAQTVRLDLKNLTPEEQMGFVGDARRLNQEGKKRVVYVIKGVVLNELLKNPLARLLWLELLSNKENTVVILRDFRETKTMNDIPDELISGDAVANIETTSDDNLEVVIAQEARKKDALVAAFDPEYPKFQKRGNVLHVRSAIEAALARSILESFTSISAYTSEILASLEIRFREAYIKEGRLKTAA